MIEKIIQRNLSDLPQRARTGNIRPGCQEIIRHVYRDVPIRLERYESGWLAFLGNGHCVVSDYCDRREALHSAQEAINLLL